MSFALDRFRKGYVHFVGCAGVGTLPLARIFLENGFRVSGSDLAPTNAMRQLNIPCFTGHSAEHLPPDDGAPLLLIHSSAAEPDNPEILAAKARRDHIILRRGSALAAVAGLYRRTVSVSGSHGKTSVSGMLAFLFQEAGLLPGYLVGGFLSAPGWAEKNGEAGQGNDLFITEVDESDGTHTEMYSKIGIVTNVEDDHAWSVGGREQLFENFKTYARKTERLIYVGSAECDRLFADHPSARRLDPDLKKHAAALALFDPAALKQWGRYQKLNALTALAAAEELGDLTPAEAAAILSRFPGVERRMSVRYQSAEHLLIEDYAHHPTELRASLEALREVYPGKRLIVIFQPHRYARLERYFYEFAAELKKADKVFITPVFAAWTAGGKVDSSDLADAIGGDTAIAVSGSWAEIAKAAAGEIRSGDLAAVIGAGDVKDVIAPLTDLLTVQADGKE